VPRDDMTAACRPVALPQHDVHVDGRLSRCSATSRVKASSSTRCAGNLTKRVCVPQSNHATVAVEEPPMAVRRAAVIRCSLH
jgi:hypothetical protein